MFNQLTRPGTLPIVLAVMWAACVLLYFLLAPTTDAGETIVQAGGIPAFLLVASPLVLSLVPLTTSDPQHRYRRARAAAMLLFFLTVFLPIPIGFYAISLVGLGYAAYQLRAKAG